MGLNLSGLFHTNVSGGSIANVSYGNETAESGVHVQTGNTGAYLEPGQTISGEIVSKDGMDIQIRITEALVIHARMEQNVQVSEGQNVIFEVASNSSGVTTLRPLFQNMSQENTAMKALSQAGIEINGKSMQMTSSMMREGLSVDRESVQTMYREVLDLPDTEISAAVQLSRLQIPVTAENLQQFAAYQNYEHQLLSAFSQVAEEIPQAVADIFAEGNMEEGTAFINQLLTIFQGETGQEAAAVREDMPELQGTPLQDPVMEDAAVPENMDEALLMGGEKSAVREGAAALPDITLHSESMENMALSGEESVPDAQVASAMESGEDTPVLGRQPIPQENRMQLAELVRGAGGSEEAVRQISQGEISSEELYQIVRELAGSAQGSEAQAAVRELFLSPEFQKIFQDKVSGQWTLAAPESIGKKEVSRLYERLNEQTRQLTEALTEAVRADSPLFKSVQTIRENVDFMNQLNQMYAYVQLPLKFKGENAHGDLYVYTNKKNLAKKEGGVSAFLHLEMEHLGTVDVYVAMERGKVSTNFCLADEESLELLEKNMDMLTKRLTERGYHMEAKLTLKDEPGNVMEEIMQTDRNISLISEQSFDVRA